MRGHHGTALNHIQSAIKIIAELQKQTIGNDTSTAASLNGLIIPKIPLLPMETLTTLFTRLDSQLCELQPTLSENILTPSFTYEPGFSPTIPKKFTSTTEARNCFEYLYNAAIHDDGVGDDHITDVEEIDDEMKEKIDIIVTETLNKCARWKMALNAFVRSPPRRLDDKDKQAIDMLNLRYMVTTQAFSASRSRKECEWDNFTDEYETIINLAESILASSSSSSLSKVPNPSPSQLPHRTLSLDPGVVVPLFNTIWKCRISSIRRRGIRLLKQYPRQEGIWDGVLAAIACERILEIEEEGVGEIFDPKDLPEWKRVLNVNVVFDMEGKTGVLSYEKMKGRDSSEKVYIEDELCW
jgi:hypothetical protein